MLSVCSNLVTAPSEDGTPQALKAAAVDSPVNVLPADWMLSISVWTECFLRQVL